jgi:hypothetical protein
MSLLLLQTLHLLNLKDRNTQEVRFCKYQVPQQNKKQFIFPLYER